MTARLVYGSSSRSRVPSIPKAQAVLAPVVDPLQDELHRTKQHVAALRRRYVDLLRELAQTSQAS